MSRLHQFHGYQQASESIEKSSLSFSYLWYLSLTAWITGELQFDFWFNCYIFSDSLSQLEYFFLFKMSKWSFHWTRSFSKVIWITSSLYRYAWNICNRRFEFDEKSEEKKHINKKCAHTKKSIKYNTRARREESPTTSCSGSFVLDRVVNERRVVFRSRVHESKSHTHNTQDKQLQAWMPLSGTSYASFHP